MHVENNHSRTPVMWTPESLIKSVQNSVVSTLVKLGVATGTKRIGTSMSYSSHFQVQIRAGIWHQPAYPINNEAIFRGKQGRVHACVAMDSVIEFNRYLKVPLNPKFAKTSL